MGFYDRWVTGSAAILILRLIVVNRVERSDEPTSLLDELKKGVRYAFGNPLLKGIIICYGFSFFLITPQPCSLPMIDVVLEVVWRLTANEIVWTVGSFVGARGIALRNIKNKILTIALCLVALASHLLCWDWQAVSCSICW